MDTILATGITGLFAYWVWMLKQDVVRLQQQIFRKAATPAAHGGTIHVTVTPPPSHVPAADDSRRAKIERKNPETEGGIPTWTLG